MRPWFAPLAVAAGVAVALALIFWAVYEALGLLATLITYALIGVILMGYGLDPTVIDLPGSAPPSVV